MQLQQMVFITHSRNRIAIFTVPNKREEFIMLVGEATLVVVGQNILLLLVSRPTILLLLKDRAFQVWKRNSMSIDLVHDWFFKQKFEYLHNNPCQPHWQLATLSEDYKHNSASFYDTGEDRFGFLTHNSQI